MSDLKKYFSNKAQISPSKFVIRKSKFPRKADLLVLDQQPSDGFHAEYNESVRILKNITISLRCIEADVNRLQKSLNILRKKFQ